jgi:predicted Fe-S protein YdhL (DUF1289 family)
MAQIETPCVQTCVLDAASQRCRGCGRTLAEIANWTSYTADERRRVMAALPARLAAMRPRLPDAVKG